MNELGRDVYIIDGGRTPFLKVDQVPGPFSAADLAVATGRELLACQPFLPAALDEVILGCMIPSVNEANIARVVALRLGCPQTTPAYTVQRNCASGMQALDCAYKDIAMGRHELVLAGGTEAMSRAPLLYQDKVAQWFAAMAKSKSRFKKSKLLFRFPWVAVFSPVISLLHGLTDPVCGYNMGQTAEQVAHRFGISREQMDAYALSSHQRAAAALQDHVFSDITTLYDNAGHYYDHDTGVRTDSSLEQLAKLKPIFDKPFGQVTAGNSSQITDGSALMILASATAVKRYALKVVGRIRATQWSGCDPKEMGLGPAYAITQLLEKQKILKDDIAYWEINEAFAGQVLGCLAALNDPGYCHDYLGLSSRFGEIPLDKLNVNGGAIAIGHPVGASGARIVLQLLQVLKRQEAKLGVASLCIGGGLGGAMLIENVSEVQS